MLLIHKELASIGATIQEHCGSAAPYYLVLLAPWQRSIQLSAIFTMHNSILHSSNSTCRMGCGSMVVHVYIASREVVVLHIVFGHSSPTCVQDHPPWMDIYM